MKSSELISMLVVVILLVMAVFFLPVIFGSVDAGIDMNGSDYESQYNSTTETTILSIVVLQWIPYLLVFFLVLVVLYGMYKKLS